jgi:heme-degrading monooxygenase HmoA
MILEKGAEMTELLSLPPPPDVIASLGDIERMRMGPTMLNIQEGPEGHRGPEGAAAVLLLQATFSRPERAEAFWRAAAGLMKCLADAPGFIRRYSFADGPTITLLALWRTVADAHAFFASDRHQAVMHQLYRERWQYSHFAALFESPRHHDRVVFCDECDAVTRMPAKTCSGCGAALLDIHMSVTNGGDNV